MGRPKIPFEEKYIPEPNSGCWLWSSGWDKDGYGTLTGSKRAHRVSWESVNGPIPKGFMICHKCDTPPCVNPSHMFLGTAADNSRDCVSKKRANNGAKHHKAKLNDKQVIEILNDRRPAYVIARDYGVSDVSICFIKLGRTWSNVTGIRNRFKRNG